MSKSSESSLSSAAVHAEIPKTNIKVVDETMDEEDASLMSIYASNAKKKPATSSQDASTPSFSITEDSSTRSSATEFPSISNAVSTESLDNQSLGHSRQGSGGEQSTSSLSAPPGISGRSVSSPRLTTGLSPSAASILSNSSSVIPRSSMTVSAPVSQQNSSISLNVTSLPTPESSSTNGSTSSLNVPSFGGKRPSISGPSSSPGERKEKKSAMGTISKFLGKTAARAMGSDTSLSSNTGMGSSSLSDVSDSTAALEEKLFAIALFVGASADTKNELTAYKERHWTEYMSKENIELLHKKEKKQQEVIWELFVSELSYVDHLLIMKEIFLTALHELQSDGLCKDIDGDTLFGNIEELYKINAQFASEMRPTDNRKLENSTLGAITVAKVGEAFSRFGEKFEPYITYCVHYSKAVMYLKTLEDDPKFNMLLQWCESRPRCRRLKLTDILVEPMQRIVRYPLLLREVMKTTADLEQTENHKIMEDVMASVNTFIVNLNRLVKQNESSTQIADLQLRLDWSMLPQDIPEFNGIKEIMQGRGSIDLAASNRQLLHSGKLQKWNSGRSPSEVEVFLFNDMLLLTKLKKKRFAVYQEPLSTDTLIIKELPSDASIKNAIFIMSVNKFGQARIAYTFIAENENARKMWMTHFLTVANPDLNSKEAIELARAKLAEEEKSKLSAGI